MSDDIYKRKRYLLALKAFELAKIPIVEYGRDNDGPMLRRFIKPYYNDFNYGEAWCASFASACIVMVDREIKGGVYGKTSKNSQLVVYSAEYKLNRPFVGSVIAWEEHSQKGKGHAGVVIWVSPDEKSIVVAEGNTGSSGKSEGSEQEQNREGFCTMVKYYNYSKIQNPSKKRGFHFYGSPWPESKSSLYSPFTPEQQKILDENAKRIDRVTPDIAKKHFHSKKGDVITDSYIASRTKNIKEGKIPPSSNIKETHSSSDIASNRVGSGSSRREPPQEKPKPSMRDLGVDAGSAVGIELAALSEFKPTEPVSTNKITQKDKESFTHESKVVSTPTIVTKDPSTITINEPQQT